MARQKILQRITLDRQRVSADLEPILTYIAERIFLPGFSLTEMRRTLRLTRSQLENFQQQLDVMFKAYTHELKMEAAEWLLRETDLEIWRIANFSGYSVAQTFASAFRQWSGKTPGEVRKEALCLAVSDGSVEEAADDGLSWDTWILGIIGAPDSEAALRLRAWLGSRSQKVVKAIKIEFIVGPSEQLLAEAVVRVLSEFSHEVRLHFVCYQFRFPSPVLFHLLGQKSLEEGRVKRQRGVEWALLAREFLEGNADALGEVAHDLRALAWARFGNALRLVQDFGGAEEAFRKVTEAREASREHRNLRSEAEVLWLEAGLREHQRRFPEALEKVNRAIALAHAAGDQRLLVQVLVRQAEIGLYSGQLSAAFSALHEAEGIEHELEGQLDLHFLVHQVTAVVQVLAGDYQAAVGTFPKLKELCRVMGRQDGWLHTRWLEGLASWSQGLFDEARGSFEEARAGFNELGDLDNTAMVALDLAELHLESGCPAETIRLAAQVIPVFEALGIERESVAAAQLLQEATSSEEVSLHTLRQVRQELANLNPLWAAFWSGTRKASRHEPARPAPTAATAKKQDR